MDKGKGKIVGASNSDSSPESSDDSVNWPEECEKQRQETQFWKNAFSELCQVYLAFIDWSEKQRQESVMRNRGQYQNLRNMTDNNERYFQQTLAGITSQLENTSRQLSNAMHGTNWIMEDYIR